MLPTVLKDLNLFVDGRGYLGRVVEIELPKLTRKTEEFRGGGMETAIDIDMGMEKPETAFTLKEYDSHALKLWGVNDGKGVIMRIKGSMESEGGIQQPVVPIEIVLRGRYKEMEMGTWKPGEESSLKIQMSLQFYELKINGITVIKIDVVNMVHEVNGVDKLAARRFALGV